jgi:hypothetical protein
MLIKNRHIHIQESRIQELAASLQAAQSALVVQQQAPIPLYGQGNILVLWMCWKGTNWYV